MGQCYAAKAAAAADVCASGPAGWNAFWPFPGPPWAPGWPITVEPGYTLNLTLGSVAVGAAVSLISQVLFNLLDDSSLQCHSMVQTALINGSTLQLSNDGVTYSNSLTNSVKNYSGSSYGFSKNLYLNLSSLNIGDSGSVTVTITSTNPTISATVNFTVAGNFVLAAISGSGTHQAQTSIDAVSWAAQTTNVTDLESVCYADTLGLFVAVGLNAVQTSPDAITWTSRTAQSGTWRNVCWSNALGLLVAVNDDSAVTTANCVMTSTDGIEWTLRSTPGRPWKSVTYSPALTQFVAVASTGSTRAVMLSSNGTSWALTTPTSSMSSAAAVAWSSTLGLYVCVGNGAAYSSPDGQTWTNRAITGTYKGVAWSGSAFVAVGTSGVVSSSTNGTSWTSRTAAEANDWQSVCWSSSIGLFVAVATSGTQRVMTSPDGTTWTAQTQAESNSLAGICAKS